MVVLFAAAPPLLPVERFSTRIKVLADLVQIRCFPKQFGLLEALPIPH
jgi:hypothetical protein